MIVPIKTNELAYTFNAELFEKEYNIFCICTSDKYFKYGAYIIDAPLLSDSVCSVYFEFGNKMYVLMSNSDDNASLLYESVSKVDGGDRITISPVDISTFNKKIIFQLLLNSLGNFEKETLRFNNLTGHLYCFHPKWVKEKKPVRVPCLELKISPEFRLNMEVHTFTSELCRHKMEFNKKKFEEYTKYVISKSKHLTLRRKLKDDTEPCLIMKQIKGKKTSIKFINVYKKEEFEKSKMGVLAAVIEDFNKSFADFAHLDFKSITDYKARTTAKENDSAIKKLVADKPIKIVDGIGDENSINICDDICSIISEKYDVTARCGKNISKKHLNIKVIHAAEYYENTGSKDPHREYEDASVQHITIEEYSELKDNVKGKVISTLIHEMLIKDDLVKQKISLFDWEALEFDSDIDFGIQHKDKERARYFFMRVHPDGTFNISEQTLNLFEQSDYQQLMDIFVNDTSNKIQGIIRNATGDINVIKDTGWITIPEIFKIKEELTKIEEERNKRKKEPNSVHEKLPGIRGKVKSEKLLSACIDIKLFREGDCQYYFVGVIGSGMREYVNCATNIRQIQSVENSNLMFEKLLPLMDVTFVRNGQLTVVPFPFKYLREYIKVL